MVEDLIVNRLVVTPNAGEHSWVFQHLPELFKKLLELGLIKLLLVVDADISSMCFSYCLVDSLVEIKGTNHYAQIRFNFCFYSFGDFWYW